MAAPTKWTLDSFGDDPEVDSDLPRPVEITRAALADPNFDVESFLNTHSQYRTLRDTQFAVLQWEDKLYAELVSVINENFMDFVAAASSLEAGTSYLDSISADISRFGKLASRTAETLERSTSLLDSELLRHKQLCIEEGKARRLLFMFDLLDELETALHDAETEDAENLESLARSYVAIVSIAEAARDVKAVNLLRITIQSSQRELLESLNSAMAGTESENSKLRLLEAREWVRSTQLEPAQQE